VLNFPLTWPRAKLGLVFWQYIQLTLPSYTSNALLCQSGIETMFYPKSVGESHFRDNGRFGRRSRQLELDISIRPILRRPFSSPGRSNRQAGELGRPSSLLDLRVRYVLHVRGNDLSSAHRMNRKEGNLQYEGW
jgi:hypothetical protein